MSIFGLYLSAGRSQRLQGRKLTLPVQGQPLGSWALQAALHSQVDQVLVVTQEQGLPSWMDGLGEGQGRWQLVQSPESWRGLSWSIASGVQRAQELQAEAVVILLADQPLVTAEMIDALVLRYLEARKKPPFVAASCAGIVRPPALFMKSMFPDLLGLQGDEGARNLLRQPEACGGLVVPFRDPMSFFDVDTEGDYQTLLQHLKGG